MKTYKTKIFQILLTVMLIISVDVVGQFFDFPAKTLGKAELIATYSFKWREDSLNLKFPRQEDMMLMLGNNMSVFMSLNFYNNFQEGRKYEQEGRLDEYLSLPYDKRYRTRFSYTIYKNFPTGKILFQDKVMDNFLQYEEDINAFKWVLSNETSTISDYKVQKASVSYGGRNWVAWYCADLPFSDGPYKFRGLPGLIVKLYDTKNHYEFELVHIGKPDKETLIELSERGWMTTSKKNFLKAEDSFRENIISNAEKAGLSSASQQTAARNMAKRNNPIELDRNP
ncbi:MAG: GLPGLI family protein [Bacteroidales bacterium]|nr:GLPGLI family protein [Bacteroidales bacterium]